MLRSPLKPSEPSQWVPDSAYGECFLCSQPFTFVQRRHHCRVCGQMFCNKCSLMKVPVGRDAVEVRSCDGCFDKWRRQALNTSIVSRPMQSINLPATLFELAHGQACLGVHIRHVENSNETSMQSSSSSLSSSASSPALSAAAFEFSPSSQPYFPQFIKSNSAFSYSFATPPPSEFLDRLQMCERSFAPLRCSKVCSCFPELSQSNPRAHVLSASESALLPASTAASVNANELRLQTLEFSLADSSTCRFDLTLTQTGLVFFTVRLTASNGTVLRGCSYSIVQTLNLAASSSSSSSTSSSSDAILFVMESLHVECRHFESSSSSSELTAIIDGSLVWKIARKDLSAAQLLTPHAVDVALAHPSQSSSSPSSFTATSSAASGDHSPASASEPVSTSSPTSPASSSSSSPASSSTTSPQQPIFIALSQQRLQLADSLQSRMSLSEQSVSRLVSQENNLRVELDAMTKLIASVKQQSAKKPTKEIEARLAQLREERLGLWTSLESVVEYRNTLIKERQQLCLVAQCLQLVHYTQERAVELFRNSMTDLLSQMRQLAIARDQQQLLRRQQLGPGDDVSTIAAAKLSWDRAASSSSKASQSQPGDDDDSNPAEDSKASSESAASSSSSSSSIEMEYAQREVDLQVAARTLQQQLQATLCAPITVVCSVCEGTLTC